MIKMLIFVVLIFLFCWGPRLIINVVIKFGLQDYNQTIYSARVTCYLLSFIHSALNPFIYGFMSTNFRKMMCSSCSHHGQTSQSVNYINNNTGSCSLASGVVPGLNLNATPLTSLNISITPSDLHQSQHQHIHHIIGCVGNSMLNEKLIIDGDNHLPQQMNSLLINNNSVLIDSNSCPGQIEYDLSSYSSSDKPTSNHKTVNSLSIKPMGTETLWTIAKQKNFFYPKSNKITFKPTDSYTMNTFFISYSSLQSFSSSVDIKLQRNENWKVKG